MGRGIPRVTTLLGSNIQCSTKNRKACKQTGKYGPFKGKIIHRICPWEELMADILHKDFKTTVIKALKEPKENNTWTKQSYQYRDRKPKKKPNRNSGAKSTVTEMKKLTRGIQRQMQHRRRKQWTWSSDRGSYRGWGTDRKQAEEKWTGPKGPMGHRQEDQQMHCGGPRRSERAFQGPMAEDVPGLMKDTNKTSKKLNEL